MCCIFVNIITIFPKCYGHFWITFWSWHCFIWNYQSWSNSDVDANWVQIQISTYTEPINKDATIRWADSLDVCLYKCCLHYLCVCVCKKSREPKKSDKSREEKIELHCLWMHVELLLYLKGFTFSSFILRLVNSHRWMDPSKENWNIVSYFHSIIVTWINFLYFSALKWCIQFEFIFSRSFCLFALHVDRNAISAIMLLTLTLEVNVLEVAQHNF